jgi:hypothetical protein
VKERFGFLPTFRTDKVLEREALVEKLWEEVEKILEAREAEFQLPFFLYLGRYFLLEEIDQRWIEHLKAMEALREGIGLRGYGQKDPKQEYKKEGFVVFGEMMANINRNVCEKLFHVQIRREEQAQQLPAAPQARARWSSPAAAAPTSPRGAATATARPAPCAGASPRSAATIPAPAAAARSTRSATAPPQPSAMNSRPAAACCAALGGAGAARGAGTDAAAGADAAPAGPDAAAITSQEGQACSVDPATIPSSSAARPRTSSASPPIPANHQSPRRRAAEGVRVPAAVRPNGGLPAGG